ncbi:hypothetical protein EV363DRAFT_1393970 [Boletus edulis]|nr:hypothetical protein EV363DRAFT_1393970 [Boletus edulis]
MSERYDQIINGTITGRYSSFRQPLVGLPLFPLRSILPPYRVVLWSFIAAFCEVSVIQAAFQAHYFTQRAVPPIIGSHGASAVLIYAAINSPLEQSRTFISGHLIGAYFQLLPRTTSNCSG